MVFVFSFFAAIALGSLLFWYRKGQFRLPTSFIWLGVSLYLAAFWGLAWVRLGPPDALERNAAWLASKSEALRYLKSLPGLEHLDIDGSIWNSKDVVDAIEHPAKGPLLALAVTGSPITGWRALQLTWIIRPGLNNPVLLGLLVTLLAGLLASGEMGLGLCPPRWLTLSTTVAAWLALFGLVGQMPFIDTFGQVDDIYLRLLTSLIMTEVGNGIWTASFGLLLSALGLTLNSIVEPVTAQKYEPEDRSYFKYQ